jgi:putative DNA primase/helicase
MDAMLPVEIVREFLSQMGEPVRAAATMPHTRVRQITDRPMSLAMFIETDSAGERRNASRHNNVERLRRLIEVRAYDARPGTILVVCQEAVEIALGDDLPDNVSTVHFNALKGMNTWSDATVVMVVGRTEPSPADVEGIARALFGAEVAEVEPDEKGHIRYPRVVRGIRMRDGTGRPVEGNHHPDARGEAVRWGICEAELVQAIGRGRGVNRTAENVLQIDILTNIALPGIEVDEVTTWDAIQPGMIDVMRARGAAPLGYVDMAAGHPDLFSGAEGDWPRKPRIFVY